MAPVKGPEEDILTDIPFSYNDFIKATKGSSNSPVSYKEECCFYLIWICKFLACTSSKRVINYYLPIARFMANGTPLDLGSFVLGELYRAMFPLSTPNSPMVDPCGSCKCGPILIFPWSLLSFIQPLSHGHMGKPGCTPSTLEKSSLIQPASNSSAIHREKSHLRS